MLCYWGQSLWSVYLSRSNTNSVVGWTTHHAIAEYKGKWYLFHHDCVPSGGKTWLRSLKVCELNYDAEGHIITIDGGGE